MAIKKSLYTGGMARQTLHSPFTAMVPVTVIIEHAFTEALAVGDMRNPVGIKLTLRHQATGQTFTQTGNMPNLLQNFLWKVSPQEAFKSYSANQEAARKALVEGEQKRDATATRLIEKDFAAQVGGVDDAAFKLMESSQFSGEPMTYEEARQRVIAARQGGGGGGAIPADDEGPAVAYRPQ